MIPRKLPAIPKVLLSVPFTAVINESGIDEDGKAIVYDNICGVCAFSEKRKQIMNAEKQVIQLEGRAIMDGDIIPALNNFLSGYVSINGQRYKVYRVMRPRNPDGSVHHTTLELM